MRHRRLFWITGAALLALLAVPHTGSAEEQAVKHPRKHKHYTLVDIGAFGGPHSQVNFNSRVINARGAVAGGASTSTPDPICSFDFPFCFYFHALKWKNGVVTDLGTLPGGNNSFAGAINSHGWVAGGSDNGVIDPVFGPVGVATLWKDGQVVNLGTLGGIASLAGDINDRGQIVGGSYNAIPDPFSGDVGTQLRAFLWQGGHMRDLGTLGGPDATANFINERGQVAGISYTSSEPNPETGVPTIDPFLWDGGRMIDLGSLGGVNAAVTGLNKKGQVAGNSELTRDGSVSHAFRWDGGTLVDLGTLGGIYSEADWIDDSGEVVGAATTDGEATLRAFRWKNGHMTDLGSLDGDVCSLAFGSNSKGQVVGNSIPCDANGSSRPFLWENGGPMVDMNSLIPSDSGLILREGVFVNEAGEIAGVADLENGDQHAFLLIPREGEDHETDSGLAIESDAVLALQGRANDGAPHSRVTPEILTALRARFHRQRGMGSRAPKQTN